MDLKHTTAIAALTIFFLCTCSFKEQDKQLEQETWNYALLKGTWQGEMSCTHMFESKMFSPMIEDSVTKIVDSVYVIKNVIVDFGKEKAHFYGVKNNVASSYHYTLEEGTLLFETPPPQNSSSGEETLVVFVSSGEPEGAIDKLDEDSLIMKINVFKKDQMITNRFKLKRRR